MLPIDCAHRERAQLTARAKQAIIVLACSKVGQVDQYQCNGCTSKPKTENVTDIVSRDALPGTNRWNFGPYPCVGILRLILASRLHRKSHAAFIPPAISRGERVSIHLALGELRQQQIGLLFLVKALVQHPLIIAQVQLARESRSCPISRDLVVFELLSRRDGCRSGSGWNLKAA
jgi:hypothetical protein